MASESEVRDQAEAFARGEVSAVELHKWLSTLSTPIASDLEADMWALAFEVASGDLDQEGARRWLSDKLGTQERISMLSRTREFSDLLQDHVVTILRRTPLPPRDAVRSQALAISEIARTSVIVGLASLARRFDGLAQPAPS